MTDIGNYTILDELSRSDLGITYKAYDKEYGKNVTLKTFKAHNISAHLEKFEKEVHALYRLCHPNIVQILANGIIGDLYCISMEYVTGLSLRDIFTYCPSAGRTVPSRRDKTTKIIATPFGFLRSGQYVDRITSIMKDISLAVDYAHGQAIIHKDLKPENFIVELPEKLLSDAEADFNDKYRGPFPNRFLNYITAEPVITVKITDFGLTSHLGSGVFFDETVPIFGTPEYMSPEQALGEKLDFRTDVFSLGAVLYELLTGHSPFIASNIEETLDRVINFDPVNPGRHNYKIPSHIDSAIMKALQKDRDDRFQTAKEFAGAL